MVLSRAVHDGFQEGVNNLAARLIPLVSISMMDLSSATPMTWTCPACSTQIQHEQPRPLPKVVYRCHVCRLELVVDEQTSKLVVAPLPVDSSKG